MSEANVRYDRGDGNLFWLSPAEVKAFVAINSGAHEVAGRGEPPATTPQEDAATAALQTEAPGEEPATTPQEDAATEEDEEPKGRNRK